MSSPFPPRHFIRFIHRERESKLKIMQETSRILSWLNKSVDSKTRLINFRLFQVSSIQCNQRQKKERSNAKQRGEKKIEDLLQCVQSDSEKISNLSFRVRFPFFHFASSVIKSGMNETNSIICKWFAFNRSHYSKEKESEQIQRHFFPPIRTTFVRRIIIHLAMHKQTANKVTEKKRSSIPIPLKGSGF